MLLEMLRKGGTSTDERTRPRPSSDTPGSVDSGTSCPRVGPTSPNSTGLLEKLRTSSQQVHSSGGSNRKPQAMLLRVDAQLARITSDVVIPAKLQQDEVLCGLCSKPLGKVHDYGVCDEGFYFIAGCSKCGRKNRYLRDIHLEHRMPWKSVVKDQTTMLGRGLFNGQEKTGGNTGAGIYCT